MVGDSKQLKKSKEERKLEYKRNHIIGQCVLGSFYVITVVLGSFARTPESYWSSRSNLINKYFVKIGWFWTTIVFIIYAILIHTNKLEQFVKAIIRLLLASLYWYLFTQWLFGPSLLDRVFVLTGGECSKVSKVVPGEIFEAHVCRKGGGDWNNGHDVSGHCFMLIHASLFILEDANILFYRSNNWKNKFLFKLFGGLLFLWWWMLLMTAVYFHTSFEKFTGTLSGLFYWALMYGFIFPKYMPYMMPYELEGYKIDKKSNYWNDDTERIDHF